MTSQFKSGMRQTDRKVLMDIPVDNYGERGHLPNLVETYRDFADMYGTEPEVIGSVVVSDSALLVGEGGWDGWIDRPLVLTWLDVD